MRKPPPPSLELGEVISKTKVRRILKNPKLTDKEVERIRSDTYTLAEIFGGIQIGESNKNYLGSTPVADNPGNRFYRCL